MNWFETGLRHQLIDFMQPPLPQNNTEQTRDLSQSCESSADLYLQVWKYRPSKKLLVTVSVAKFTKQMLVS